MSVRLLSKNERWPELDSAGIFPRLNGHSPSWVRALANGLNHRSYTLVSSRTNGEMQAVLPLMLVQSYLFGKFLVSLPYLNTGGVWSVDPIAARELIDAACELADKLDVRYLELRHEIRVEHPKLSFERLEKFHLRLPLPTSEDALEKGFPAKLRSQIRKATDYEPTLAWGGISLLPDFYQVFSRNMRDLGTPVYSRRLFASILEEFAGDAEICVVRQQGQAVASALIVHRNAITEVPSASSLRSHSRTNANMWMYRQLLSRAIERESRLFDFGRSSEGSGTYRFKTQWGAKPHPAIWQYYLRRGSIDDMRPDGGSKSRLIQLWKKLPVPLTRWLGPSIVRGIP